MQKELHDRIILLLRDKGALGVNELAKLVDVPVSTLQKRLHTQSYFKQNDDKKWDLPQNVAESQATMTIEDFDVLISAQLTGIQSMYNMLTTQIKSVITLMSAHKPKPTTVAVNEPIHSEITAIMDEMATLSNIVKKFREAFTKEEFSLLNNADWVSMRCYLGKDIFLNEVTEEIATHIQTNGDKLSEKTMNHIKDFQK